MSDTSRLATVEAARALARARHLHAVSEAGLADVERDIESLWSRCEVWELTRPVCEEARVVAPRMNLRTLDALQLATFLTVRRRLGGLVLVTTDERLHKAAQGSA